ncbi:MAG: SDR family NAD(P)-dependent oxidoreductase, partial [Candidatus Latescibacterota bacterium]
PAAFWGLLREGGDAIREVPSSRWQVTEAVSRWGGFLDQVDGFDPAFFGLSPREAARMDAQQRLLLEVAWETCEDAGLDPASLAGTATGVFVGISTSDYSLLQLTDPAQVDAHTGTGNAHSIAANRLSYFLDLRGPSVAVDTACSSSLVAVHQACRALQQGDCGLALAGGVNLMLAPHWHRVFSLAGMMAADGRCKTFDAAADGYVRGEGCGLVLLKRLEDARRDGDPVLAVVLGSAVNQDGRSNGLTAPNGPAQTEVIRRALASAGIGPEEIGYVEAHGTGTALGDPIEMTALQAALDPDGAVAGPCAVGSVKTNIGHLEAAAGIAGLLKAILILRHGELPPHLHLRALNPAIRLEGSRFFVPTERVPWPGRGQRMAGVSSFGFGGTNAHLVIGAGDETSLPRPVQPGPRLLVLSAHAPAALDELARGLAHYLEAHAEADLDDLGLALAIGRGRFTHRLAAVGTTPAELAGRLIETATGRRAVDTVYGQAGPRSRVAFLCAGQGSQLPGMGRGLYEGEPVFRAAMDRCDVLLGEALRPGLLEVLYGKVEDPRAVHRTEYAQPALFAVEHALIQLWRSWGVVPDLFVGHSVGELAAACAAGVFSLEDGLRLAATRGRLMQTLPAEGAMATVRGEPQAVAAVVARVAPEVVVAAVNQPGLMTVSGPRQSVVAAVALFHAEGLQSRLLEVAHAFHSAAVDPVLPELEQLARGLSLSPPTVPLISSVTGAPEIERLTEPRYWARQAREPVLFAPALVAAQQAGVEVFVEIGPAPVLLALVPPPSEGRRAVLVPSLRPGRDDRRVALLGLGTLFAAGVAIDWPTVYPAGRRVPLGLPGYPFQRQRCWLDPRPDTDRTTTRAAALSAEESDLYELVWEEAPQSRLAPTAPAGTWLLLGDGHGLASVLAEELSEQEATVRCLTDPAAVTTAAAESTGQIHLVSLTALDLPVGPPADAAGLMAAQESGVLAALAAHRSLAGLPADRSGRLHLVTRGAQAITAADPTIALDQVPLWGLARALAIERPESWGGIVDLDPEHELVSGARAVARELLGRGDEDQVAWRGDHRYVPRLRSLARPVSAAVPAVPPTVPIDPTATYLVAGGLGELGRRTAQWLVERGVRHLTLCGRRGLPERSSWAGLSPGSNAADAARAVLDLEARGATVEVVACDITDVTAVKGLFARFGRDLPRLKGVVHAAGTVGRCPATALDEAEVRQVLAPRLAGAWNLHLASVAASLDFFLLHGSIAAVWGSADLAHYAAANAFLDGLARYRQAIGLPGLCVDWGPWAGGGMAAADNGQELAHRGIAALDAASALETLGLFLGTGLPQAICARVDWRRLRPLLEMRRPRPLLEHLPGGPTEKDRSHRPEAAGGSALLEQLRAASPQGIRSLLASHLRQALATLLEVADPTAVGLDQGFQDLGLDSLMAVELRDRLESELALSLPATLAFDYPTVAQLAAFLAERLAEGVGPATGGTVAAIDPRPRNHGTDEIAVVGLACRFPGGADSPEALWELLRDGVDAIGPVPADRWDREALFDPNPETPGTIYARQGGFLRQIDAFDHRFFGISPREAVQLDPQQRLLLEVAWEALERAGLPPERLRGSRTGVWVGIGSNDYQHLLGGERLAAVDAYTGTGNALAFAAGRLAHALGLQGPAIALDTACSSSLVAVHLACQALRTGEADRALAAGVSLILSPRVAVYLSRARALSPDGRCKTFDAAADGYGRGEGCGVVVLRRLADARHDGDPVLAVIRGSAVNHDGPSGGLTVPNVHAQVALLRQALAAAGVEPSAVDYVEAHGTGTALGDPIEMQALCTALGPGRGEDRPLVVGSIKTNIGHLEAAAGMAGLLKVVLALQHRMIPAHLHLRQLNPHIDLGGVPVEIPVATRPWSTRGDLRLAGVSAFGLSGTNAHLLIGEAGEVEAVTPVGPPRSLHLLKVAARDPEALAELAERHAEALATAEPSSWCAAANLGRSDHGSRLAVIGADKTELAAALRTAIATPSPGRTADVPPPRVAFLFTGQGAQFARMGHHLYETEPVYRQVLDRCAEVLRPHLEVPLIEVLAAPPGPGSLLDQTAYCQPALFAVEFALAALWRSWGIEPAVVLGHSLGELTAAAVAGVCSLEGGLRLAAARGRLIQSLPAGGAMAVLLAPEEQVAPRVEARRDEVAVAAINGPRQTVVSGTAEAVAAVVETLATQGVRSRRLQVSHAFHSPLMEPILAEFLAEVARVSLALPRLPLVSALTGEVADSRVATAAYWQRHLRQPVRFRAAVQALAALGCEAVVEVGPEALLAATERSAPQADWLLLPSLRREGEPWRPLIESLAALYRAGAAVEWSAVNGPGPHPYHRLPTYPFRRVRHWPAVNTGSTPRSESTTPRQVLLGRRTRSPLLEAEIFEMRCSASTPPYLGDHRLFDTVVAPAAAHLVMALAAGEEWRGQAGGALSDLSFARALALGDDQERVVQLVLRPAGDQTARFEIISLEPEGDGYLRHAEGVIGGERSLTIETVDLAAVRGRCLEEREGEGFYARFRQAGYTLGPAFRWIDRIWRASGEALGRLWAPAVPDVGAYPLHPGLVDSCFQLLAHCLDGGDEPPADGRLFVPVAVERCVHLAVPWDAEVWCHARLRPETGKETLTADLRLTDSQGQVLAEITGLTVRRLDRRHLLGSAGGSGELHELRWQILRRDSEPDSSGRWLICGGPADLVAGLSGAVAAVGGQALIQREATVPGNGSGTEVDEVVFLAGLEPLAATPDGPRHLAVRPTVERLRNLLRSLVSAGCPCRLWLVTRGARTLPGDESLDLDQALLAGLQPALALEHPELRCATVDLPLQPAAGEAAALVELLRAAGQETRLALRATGSWVPRLVAAHRARGSVAVGPRVLELPRRGVIDNLAWRPTARPAPAAGEVEVRVYYAGLNLRDVLQALDLYPGPSTPLGGEAAGVVERVGPGVTGVRPGDRVVSLLAPGGSFRTYALCPQERIFPLPPGLDLETAASLPVAWLTAAWGLERLAAVRAGEWVLIHAAAGGVGMAAVQIAQRAGARVIGTAGSEEKRAFLRSLGVEQVSDSRSLAFVEVVRRATDGRGADVVINSLAASFIEPSMALLAPGGRFIELGKADLWEPERVRRFRADVAYFHFDLVELVEHRLAEIRPLLERSLAEVGRGEVHPLPYRTFPAEAAAAAFRFMAQARHRGKILLRLADD